MAHSTAAGIISRGNTGISAGLDVFIVYGLIYSWVNVRGKEKGEEKKKGEASFILAALSTPVLPHVLFTDSSQRAQRALHSQGLIHIQCFSCQTHSCFRLPAKRLIPQQQKREHLATQMRQCGQQGKRIQHKPKLISPITADASPF